MTVDGGPEVAVDADGRIAEDVVCRKCSYNLRGLPTMGRCPECGTAVGWSIHGDLLRFSDPVWVQRLAVGALWMIWSIFLGIGAVVVGSLLDFIPGTPVNTSLLGVVDYGVGLVGYWMLTMPDPGHPESRPIWNIREMTRLLVVAGFCGEVFGAAAMSVSPGSAYVVFYTLGGVLALAGAVGSFLLFLLLRRLALRVPDRRLARQTRTVMWGIVITTATLIIGSGVMLAAMVSGALPVAGSLLFIGGAGLAFLVFAVWWTVLLFWYRRALKSAAQTALQTWMRHANE